MSVDRRTHGNRGRNRRRLGVAGAGLVLGVALAILGASSATAARISVEPRNPQADDARCGPDQPCRTIQAAVDRAARLAGKDDVVVLPGTYRENVTVENGNELSILGAGCQRGQCAVLTAADGGRPTLTLGRGGHAAQLAIVNAHPRGDAIAVVLRGGWLQNDLVATTRGTQGAIRVEDGGNVCLSTVLAPMTPGGIAIDVQDASGGDLWFEMNANQISGATALATPPQRRGKYTRVFGAWNRIRGQVVHRSGEMWLYDSIVEGRHDAPAVFVHPENPDTLSSNPVRMHLQSDTVISTGDQPALHVLTGDDASFGLRRMEVEMNLRNSIFNRRRGAAALSIQADNGNVVSINRHYLMLASPAGRGEERFARLLGGQRINRHGIRQEVPPGRLIDRGEGGVQTVDPGFVNAGSGNYHLAPGSLAIDAGFGAGPEPCEPRIDLDSQPRIQGRSRDLGAYETPPPPGQGEGEGGPPPPVDVDQPWGAGDTVAGGGAGGGAGAVPVPVPVPGAGGGSDSGAGSGSGSSAGDRSPVSPLPGGAISIPRVDLPPAVKKAAK